MAADPAWGKCERAGCPNAQRLVFRRMCGGRPCCIRCCSAAVARKRPAHGEPQPASEPPLRRSRLVGIGDAAAAADAPAVASGIITEGIGAEPCFSLGYYSIKLDNAEPEAAIDAIARLNTDYTEVAGDFSAWERENWSVKVYSSQQTTMHPFGVAIQQKAQDKTPLQGSSVHYLCFLWKARMLFALTTGSAWTLVKPRADSQFPRKIASRLVEPKFLSIASRALAGAQLFSDASFKPSQEYNLSIHETSTLWFVWREFQSSFRRSSSFYQLKIAPLSVVANADDLPVVSVCFKQSSLQIDLSLTMRDHLTILDHFIEINQGATTWSQDNTEEKDQVAFDCLNNIQRVEDPDHRKRLRHALVEALWRQYDEKQPASSLSVSHARYRDYFRSTKFILSHGPEEQTMHYPPSVGELVSWMRASLPGKLDLRKFDAAVKNMQIRFSGDRWRPHSLMTLIQGEIVYRGALYFIVDGMWLQVTGQYLTTLQRDFHAMVADHTLGEADPCHLNARWVASESWSGFDPDDLSDSSRANFEQLQGRTFSFVDTDGRVLCPYPTRALLVGHRLDKTLKKRWDGLSDLLAQAQIVEDNLKKLFPKGQDAKTVLDLLKAPYRIVEVKRGAMQRYPVLDTNGDWLRTDVYEMSWPKTSAVMKNRPLIESEISQRALSSSRPAKPFLIQPKTKAHLMQRIIKELKTGGLKSRDRCYIAGPLPDGMSDAKLKEFHATYRDVCDEEGYSRRFLERSHFLVCDQVYGGKFEKIELFDILHFTPNQLILYHVKKGFGQSTREACSQIRNAAQMIRHAIESGDDSVLHRIADNILKTDGGETAFRIKLRNKLTELPGSGSSKERFIALFKSRNKKEIVFVYAFLDDAERERILLGDGDPTHRFTELPDLSRTALQTGGYLDHHCRITGDFLNANKKDFPDPAMYDQLVCKVPKYKTTIAKVELLHIRAEVEDQHGFTFRICQIRQGKTPVPISTTLNALDEAAAANSLSAPGSQLSRDLPVEIGLPNLTSVCFANACVQMLTTAAFKRHFDTDTPQLGVDALFDAYHTQLARLRQGMTPEPLSPNLVRRVLDNLADVDSRQPPWNGGDYHDFLDFYDVLSGWLNLPTTNMEPAARLNGTLLSTSIQTFLNTDLAYVDSSGLLAIGIERDPNQPGGAITLDHLVTLGSAQYELVGCVDFVYNTRHYIAYRRSNVDNTKWIKFDDDRVEAIGQDVLAATSRTVVFALYACVDPTG